VARGYGSPRQALHPKDVNLTGEDRLHAHMMRLKMTEGSLRLLAQSVAREK